MTSSQAAFVSAIARISAKLETLQALAADHMGHSPDDINWGHVGSAHALEEALAECLEIAGIEKEGIER
jgi:hypothetical protein